jgi:antirestriction factor ArdC-like protein
VTGKPRRLSDEERAERIEKLNEELGDAVEALATSDGWMRYLAMSAKFHTYSPLNIIWLAEQAYERGTTISRVAGYKAWQEMGHLQTRPSARCRISSWVAEERRRHGEGDGSAPSPASV